MEEGLSLVQRWLKLGREYLDRSKVAQTESPSVVAWGKMFRDFHGLSGDSGLVLDVGSGTGVYLGKPYEECRYQYYEGEKVGLDPFICVLVNNGVIGVGEALPFKSHFFDVVFCVSSLSHTFDHDACIKEIYRVLKLGGRFFVGAESDRGGDVHHLWFPSTDELKRALSPPFEIKKFRYSKCMCMLDCFKSHFLRESH